MGLQCYIISYGYKTPDLRLIQREITRTCAVIIVVKHAQMWNFDTDGGEHLDHRSIQQTKFITRVYNNEWRIP
jgi:hypothetical protein